MKAEGKINDAVIENMMSWHHSGFNIYCGSAIWPHDEDGLEKLARYIACSARACAACQSIILPGTDDLYSRLQFNRRHS